MYAREEREPEGSGGRTELEERVVLRDPFDQASPCLDDDDRDTRQGQDQADVEGRYARDPVSVSTRIVYPRLQDTPQIECIEAGQRIQRSVADVSPERVRRALAERKAGR